MKKCSVQTCERKSHARGLCQLHYQREWLGVKNPRLLRSGNLRRVNLDNVAIGWLVGVLGRLPKSQP